jgi:hypothetical protein
MALKKTTNLQDMLEFSLASPVALLDSVEGEEDSIDSANVPNVERGFEGRLLFNEAAQRLNKEFSTQDLLDLKVTSRISPSLLSVLFATRWIRAELLGDSAIADLLLVGWSKQSPEVTRRIFLNLGSKTPLERKLALHFEVLKRPFLAPQLHPSRLNPLLESEPERYAQGGQLWDKSDFSHPIFGFLDEKSSAEKKKWETLDYPLDIMAADFSQLCLTVRDKKLSEEQKESLAQGLHLLVRTSRYFNYSNFKVSASKQAFRNLHKYFPKSKWTKATPVYY